MPDCHQGYGFAIGNVAATSLPHGIISPGGVGYDINCIAGNTLILHEYGYTTPVAEMANDLDRALLCCQNFAAERSDSTHVVRFLQQKPQTPVYRMTTESGREIVATADHPFWTPDGMVVLEKVKQGDKIALYSFMGTEYSHPSH